MSRTLQDPENYVGLKSKIETACPWAPSADPMTIYIYINRKCSAITAMPQLCPEGVSPVRYWMLRAALRQWAMCWMLLFSRETNPGWAHTGTNMSEPPQEQVVVMGRRVVQPEAWSVPLQGALDQAPATGHLTGTARTCLGCRGRSVPSDLLQTSIFSWKLYTCKDFLWPATKWISYSCKPKVKKA